MNIINYDVNTTTLTVSATADLTDLTVSQYQLMLIDILDKQTTAYILGNYPQHKQLSDHVDLQYWGGWLQNNNNSSYTTQYIYATTYSNAYNIATGNTTLQDAINEQPSDEQIGWAHLFSASVRIGWVKAVKDVYNYYYNEIMNQTTISELETIDINSITYPTFIDVSTLTTSASASG